MRADTCPVCRQTYEEWVEVCPDCVDSPALVLAEALLPVPPERKKAFFFSVMDLTILGVVGLQVAWTILGMEGYTVPPLVPYYALLLAILGLVIWRPKDHIRTRDGYLRYPIEAETEEEMLEVLPEAPEEPSPSAAGHAGITGIGRCPACGMRVIFKDGRCPSCAETEEAR